MIPQRRRFLAAMLALACVCPLPVRAQAAARRWSMAIHGGAGVISRATLTPAAEAAYREGLARAIAAGGAVLERGGAALDAVQAAIEVMEDDPLFNAGRGAVFTAEGKNELDAAVMDGSTLAAGAVAGVTRTRHPIALARAVMEKTPHVMVAGAGADALARELGLEQVDPSFFFTERRWQGLVEELKKAGKPIPPRPAGAPPAPAKPSAQLEPAAAHRYGTVGAVAVDRKGHVAAGTSTGGTQAKRPGRIGDSPIIGAGTYASDRSCAVSGTGTGEYFIRLTIAREIAALSEYKGMSLQAAVDEAIQKRLAALGGDGGAIAIAPDGTVAWSCNTPGMYRARLAEGGRPEVFIFKDGN